MVSIARQITRFDSKKAITELFKKARRVIKHPGLHILLAPQQQNIGRILIITSAKVGNAVQRNKIRRQLKSIFYEEKLYERRFDCIAIVQKERPHLSFVELKNLLLQAYIPQ